MTNLKIAFLSITLLAISCDKTNSEIENNLSVLTELKGESGISYTQSLEHWNSLKSQNGNSYTYQTTFTSWARFGSTTELEVLDGVVISRKYQEFEIEGDNQIRIVDTYSESEATLGTHVKGENPLTIDQLYQNCSSTYLVVSEIENELFFETTSNGQMTLCGFVPKGCQDDCYQGIQISGFDWAN